MAIYTSKIIKAGALLSDTKTLLSHWDAALSDADNLEQIQRVNALGKASRSRVSDILVIMRQRYLAEKRVGKALVVLAKNRLPAASFDRILYFHAARADSLLYDTVTRLLLPMQTRGLTNVDVSDIYRAVRKWVMEGKATSQWSESTTLRVCRGLLSALRDFGVLRGAVQKRISTPYLAVEAFAYVAFYLKQHQPSGAKLLELPDWKLFLLSSDGVERLLFEAHQHDLLEYHAAGSVTRLTFPVGTLEEYARVIAQRAH